MKMIISISMFVFLATICVAQKDSTYVGKWKFAVDAGEKGSSISYLLLNADSTFITGADSTFADANKKTAQGKWGVTKNGDIRLVPSDTSRETHYYKHMSGWKFHYTMNEKNGKTEDVHLLEMDIYLEKLIYVKKGKKNKRVRSNF